MTTDSFLDAAAIHQAMLLHADVVAPSDAAYARLIRRRLAPYAHLTAALAAFLAQRLACDDMPEAVLWQLLHDALGQPDVTQLLLHDLSAFVQRDAACTHIVEPFLFYKGFHGLQAARAAHVLWQNGARGTARWLQSRVAEVFCIDIHPAAQLGHGLMLDHATGIVIGETAVLGNNCSLLHGVTLGGNGVECGDRHPKIGHSVLIGAGATILGNITVGNGARVAACSVVLQNVAAGVTVAGIPAKVVREAAVDAAQGMNHVFAS